jgi:hypothetical protein
VSFSEASFKSPMVFFKMELLIESSIFLPHVYFANFPTMCYITVQDKTIHSEKSSMALDAGLGLEPPDGYKPVTKT